MPCRSASGFSLAEALVALALMAVTSAAVLPAMAAAARLHRDGARETTAVRIASTRLEMLRAARDPDAPGASGSGSGGSLDASLDGWSEAVDRGGATASDALAEYDCRWRITGGAVTVMAVRVTPRGGGQDVTLSTVWHE